MKSKIAMVFFIKNIEFLEYKGQHENKSKARDDGMCSCFFAGKQEKKKKKH